MYMEPLLSPLIYANNFIERSLKTEIPISPMKMQKLLYLLYARYYYLYNAPLFAHQFEKWQYGPVLSEVYSEFKDYRDKPIKYFVRFPDDQVYYVKENNKKFKNCFNEVWVKFGFYSGIDLSVLTHRKGSAWSKVLEYGDFLKAEDIKEDGKQLFEHVAG